MAGPARLNDAELLQLVAAGDEDSFAELFHLYKYKLYGYLFRLTGSREMAEDLVQDIFLKLWGDRASLSRIENFSSYIFRMAHNRSVNAFRRMAKQMLILKQLRDGLTDATQATPEYEFSLKETEELLHQAIGKLPPQQKKVYLLSRDEGLKYEEIAGRLHITPGTVKNHMIQALGTIREHLSKYPGLLTALYLFLLALAALER